MAEEQKSDPTKAKIHTVLQDLQTQLRSKHITEKVTVLGKEFVLKAPLSEDEEIWAETQTRSDSTISFSTSNNAARLAAGLVSIAGIEVDKLFEYPEGMKKEVREAIDGNSARRRYWVMAQLLTFIAEEGNRGFTGKLIDAQRALDKRIQEAQDEAPKS